jgi:hypothetical protein
MIEKKNIITYGSSNAYNGDSYWLSEPIKDETKTV